MPKNASPYDYKLPNYLTDEDLQKIRRQKIWLGRFGVHEDTKEHLIQKRAREAGLGAIDNIRGREETGRMALDKMTELGQNVQSKSGDKEALSRFANSPGMAAHADTLQNLQPDYNQLVEEEVTSKGLGQLPEVKDFLSRREGQMEGEAASAQMVLQKQVLLQMAQDLKNDPKYGEKYAVGARILEGIARAGMNPEDILKNLGKAAEGEATTLQGIEKEGVMQTGRLAVKDKEQSGVMEKAGFDRATGYGLESLKQKGRVQLKDMDVEQNKAKAKAKKKGAKNSFANVFAVYDKIGEFVTPVGGALGLAATGWSKAKTFVGIDDPIQALSDYNGMLQNQAARVLGGEKGVMTDRDVKRFKSLTYKKGDTVGERAIKRKAYQLFMSADITPEAIGNEMGKLVTSLYGKDVDGTNEPAYTYDPNIGTGAGGEKDGGYTDDDETRYQELMRKQREGTLQ